MITAALLWTYVECGLRGATLSVSSLSVELWPILGSVIYADFGPFMEVKMRFSKTEIAGFLMTGAAVGATVALIFAPKSGAQTRKDIRRFSKKASNQLDDLQHDVRDQINGGYGQVIAVFDNVKEYVKDGKSALQKLIKTA
jgi:gas vesicle protein